jgi:hypothetical protein
MLSRSLLFIIPFVLTPRCCSRLVIPHSFFFPSWGSGKGFTRLVLSLLSYIPALVAHTLPQTLSFPGLYDAGTRQKKEMQAHELRQALLRCE